MNWEVLRDTLLKCKEMAESQDSGIQYESGICREFWPPPGQADNHGRPSISVHYRVSGGTNHLSAEVTDLSLILD